MNSDLIIRLTIQTDWLYIETERSNFILKKSYSEITPYIHRLAEKSTANNRIQPEMYAIHDVKRGLRDLNGNGVVTGLTEISNIVAKKKDENGNSLPCEGKLFYRGINIKDLVGGFRSDNRFGFEEIAYLLLFGNLPDREHLEDFQKLVTHYRTLPPYFAEDVLMRCPSAWLFRCRF